MKTIVSALAAALTLSACAAPQTTAPVTPEAVCTGWGEMAGRVMAARQSGASLGETLDLKSNPPPAYVEMVLLAYKMPISQGQMGATAVINAFGSVQKKSCLSWENMQ